MTISSTTRSRRWFVGLSSFIAALAVLLVSPGAAQAAPCPNSIVRVMITDASGFNVVCQVNSGNYPNPSGECNLGLAGDFHYITIFGSGIKRSTEVVVAFVKEPEQIVRKNYRSSSADGGGIVRQDQNILDAKAFTVAGDRLRVDTFFGTPCGDVLMTLGWINVFN
jgi:hypothetical protein